MPAPYLASAWETRTCPWMTAFARWEQVYAALDRAEKRGHIVALHQYGMPDIWGPRNLYDWYIYRLEHQVLSRLPFKRLQFAVTEMGIDGMIAGGEPRGWRHFTDAGGYTRQLLRSGSYGERFSGRVLGHSVFTLGHFAPWDTYDIAGQVAQALAVQSDRGAWSEVDTDVTNIRPGGFVPSREPGVEALPDSALDSNGDVDPSPGDDGPLPQRRLDGRFHDYHMTIKSICERPDQPSGEFVYILKDVFMTVNGSWEDAGMPGGVPAWAKQAYLTAEFTEAGADRHLFGAVIGPDGQLMRDARITYWSDGFEKLGDPEYDGFIKVRAKPESGWANMPMAGSSSFAPDRGESGPWCWMPEGAAEVVCGGGLPLNHHVSTFVVWQAVRRTDWEAHKDVYAEFCLPFPGLRHPVARRISRSAPYYRLRIQPIIQIAPRRRTSSSYVVKDLFTVAVDRVGDAVGHGSSSALGGEGLSDTVPGREMSASQDQPVPPTRRSRTQPGGVYGARQGNQLRSRGFGFYYVILNEAEVLSGIQIDSRWANLQLSAEDAYWPTRNQSGPWRWLCRFAGSCLWWRAAVRKQCLHLRRMGAYSA